MIDVHCHLADNKFKCDLPEILEAARRAEIRKIVAVAEFPSQFDRLIEICQQNPGFVYAGIGVHPIQKRNKAAKLKHLENVESYLSRFQQYIVCVGEIGLDHTSSQFKLSVDDLKEQEDVFRKQLEYSRQFDLPVNVHSRSAPLRTIEVLRSENIENVILHAFDGNQEEAAMGVQAGYYFSVPPSFERSADTLEVVKTIPMENLLLETDAPALGPLKGERNEPKNLEASVDIISKCVQNGPKLLVMEFSSKLSVLIGHSPESLHLI
ncbi:unnamed protein product [Caenorhabditis bovis]|uniref:Uncharacterized protein n=1 Tax=Caenorhabditis bovis TaxID=2654633 RepID=A0A8S1EYP7_9PELO|nr:unnamed protein product [Caenorhabditis bovis]